MIHVHAACLNDHQPQERHGEHAQRCLKDYDFGGEADLWIDWLNDPESDNWSTDALKEHLGLDGAGQAAESLP